VSLLHIAARALPPALLAAAATVSAPAQVSAASSEIERPARVSQPLAQANAALQAGEADKALALLASLPSLLVSLPDSSASAAEAANLECRVRLMLEQWNAAAALCQQAVRLDGQNAAYHLWLARALGEKADRASFLTAYALAKRVRAEFEESVRLDPRSADALFDLGEFYRQAPGIVGGGIEKAQGMAEQLDKVDPARAHQLRGRIAEEQKDYDTAEREFKQAITAGAHPAAQWISLANFYRHRKRWAEMESAVHSGAAAAERDKRAGLALYDGATLLTETNRDPALAAKMLDDYLAGPAKTEEAPAFVAHIRLARLKEQLGDATTANREQAAALALAHEYRPAQDLSSQATNR
jgi:tetratricopeptide (TPR) repeat protein